MTAQCGLRGASADDNEFDVATPQSITQIPGICAAHYTNAEAGTGCTVIICPEGATGAVDVRGGAPATRETDLLKPEETVQVLHAVVLSGGSAYGLESMCGVANKLEKHGIGLPVPGGVVPIVSGACIFDLACGEFDVRPTREDGAAATEKALRNATWADTQGVIQAHDPESLQCGNVGVGTGATVGKLAGKNLAMKGGFGENIQQAGTLICGAVSAANACGDIIDPETHARIAGVRNASDPSQLASSTDMLCAMQAQMPLDTKRDEATGDGVTGGAAATPNASTSSPKSARTNTTISCIVTNARLNKAQATKVAQMCADAYAHVISPTHTTNDGDTIFVMATNQVDAAVDVVGVLATRALERAIVDGVMQAKSAYGFVAARDL